MNVLASCRAIVNLVYLSGDKKYEVIIRIVVVVHEVVNLTNNSMKRGYLSKRKVRFIRA
jgi:hypothetical protein